MDSFADYTIPVWHPLVVHLPIAALALAGVASLIWALTRHRGWFVACVFLSVAGAVGAAAAYLSGDAMLEQAAGVPVVDELVGLHKQLGLLTLLSAIIGAICWAAVAIANPKTAGLEGAQADRRAPSNWIRAGLVLVTLVAAFLGLRTGHLGGIMVWGVPAP